MCNFERTKLSRECINYLDNLYKLFDEVIHLKQLRSRDDGIEVTLLPIPNRTVKVYSADGTAWETVWQSRTLRGILVEYKILVNRVN